MPVPTIPLHLTRSSRSLPAHVAATMRDQILAGVYTPGERLHARDLAIKHDVSPATVQLALRTLTSDGLVETASNRYTRIITPEPDAAAHAAASLRMIASALTDTDTTALMRVNTLIDAAYGSTDTTTITTLRTALTTAASQCPNRLLTKILTPGIDGAIYRLRFTTTKSRTARNTGTAS